MSNADPDATLTEAVLERVRQRFERFGDEARRRREARRRAQRQDAERGADKPRGAGLHRDVIGTDEHVPGP